MDVRCPQCGTEYVFDGDRIGPRGVSVKCAACRHVFRVFPPTAQDSKQWIIRQADGTKVEFKELTTLQKWIVEGRIRREHEISKDGTTWRSLGDIKELEPFFDVVERAERAERAPSTSSFERALDGPPRAVTEIDNRAASMRSQVFSPRDLMAASSSDALIPSDLPEQVTERPAGPKPSSRVPAMLGVLAAFAVGAGLYVLTQPPSSKEAEASGPAAPSPEPVPAPRAGRTPASEGAPEAEVRAAEPAGTLEIPSPPAEPALRRTARKATRTEIEGLLLRADRAFEEGRLEDAVDAYGAAAEARPDDPEPHLGKGRAFAKMGRPRLARVAYARAAELLPGSVEAELGLARAHDALGDAEAAQAAARRVLGLVEPDDPRSAEADAFIRGED